MMSRDVCTQLSQDMEISAICVGGGATAAADAPCTHQGRMC